VFINLLNYFRHYASPSFRTSYSPYLVIVHVSYFSFLPAHFISMEQILSLMIKHLIQKTPNISLRDTQYTQLFIININIKPCTYTILYRPKARIVSTRSMFSYSYNCYAYNRTGIFYIEDEELIYIAPILFQKYIYEIII